MFRIDSEKDFFNAFRPRDRDVVAVPEGAKFPMVVLDYLAWAEPAGVRTFLLLTPPGHKKPVGVAFRRDQSRGGEPGARMCEWCHTHASADEIGLLTTDAGSRKRVGTTLCLDLSCGPKLEEAADRQGKNARHAAKALLGRMEQFLREALKVTPESRE